MSEQKENKIEEVFAIDLGNHQVKMKSSKSEIKNPSTYFNKERLPKQLFGNPHAEGNKTYEISNDDFSAFVWGKNLDFYHQSEDLIDTFSRSFRYESKATQRLLNFALARMGIDFKESQNSFLPTKVIMGLPITDLQEQKSTVEIIKNIVSGKHLVTVDGRETMVEAARDNIYVVPQYMGTMIHLAMDEDGNYNDKFRNGKFGIGDLGGGTRMANIVAGLDPVGEGYEDLKGVDTLVRAIAGKEGISRLSDLKKTLRSGNKKDGYIYRPTNNEISNKIITQTVIQEIKNFTSSVANFIRSNFKDIDEFDGIILTGGGVNLLDRAILRTELGESLYGMLIFVKDPEFANVRGYYKIAKFLV